MLADTERTLLGASRTHMERQAAAIEARRSSASISHPTPAFAERLACRQCAELIQLGPL